MMTIILCAFALAALVAFIALRVWLLRHISNAGSRGDRPFDYEDTEINPYEPR